MALISAFVDTSGLFAVLTRVRVHFIRDWLPSGGFFAGHEWRMSPTPFPLHSAGLTLATVSNLIFRCL